MSLNERVFHAVPFFHYDVVYLCPRQEYLEQAFGLLDAALSSMEEDPEATFLVEQVYLLSEWFKLRPDVWSRMRRLAAEGRLDVAPGMFVMPDMSMVSGESLYQQVETGFRWCMETLGLRPSVCWMPDPWNHPGTLPQFLSACGYSAYVFARGADLSHPNHFRWRGPDGTEVLAVRMPLHYDFFPPHLAAEPDAEARLVTVLDRLDALYPPGQPVLVPVGADFAAPSPHTGPLLSGLRARGVRIAFSTLSRFARDLRHHWAALPVIPADFSPTFQGTFSSRIGLKQANRNAESLVDRLRRYEAAGGPTSGQWRETLPVILRHQFHDTIAGSIVDAAAEEAVAEHEEVLRTLRAAFGRRTPASARVVFNPSMEERTECVYLPGWTAPGAMDAAGHPLPLQRVEGGAVVLASVPPLATVEVHSGPLSEDASTFKPMVRATATSLENDLVRVDLDGGGNIQQVTLLGRAGDIPLLPRMRPMFGVLTLEHDYGDFWSIYRQPLNGAYVGRTPYLDPLPLGRDPRFPWVQSVGAFSDRVEKTVTVLESGPLRARLRVEGELGLQRWRMGFTQTITLCAGCERIEFRTVLRPEAKFARVRAAFRPSLGQTARHDHVPFGVMPRGISEHAALNGVALHGSHAGLLLLNRGLPGNGWDGDVLSLSLLRCVAMEYKGPSEGGYELGTEHVYDYAVVPFRETAPPDLVREGDRYNLPLAEAAAPVSGPPFSWDAPNNVQVTRIERVGDAYRLHGHESRGLHAHATISVPGGRVARADALGDPTGMPVEGQYEMHLNPWQAFLLRITVDGVDG